MFTVETWSDIAQFVVGGGLTVAATKLSVAYGNSIGALVWVVPFLTYVMVVALRYQGKSANFAAQLCFDGFGTTIINAFTSLLGGVFILTFPPNIALAVAASLASSLAIGYVYQWHMVPYMPSLSLMGSK